MTNSPRAVHPAARAYAQEVADGTMSRRELMGQIMVDEGVIIQPFWRSIYRHTNGNVVGADTHPIFEIHLHKLGLAA